LNIAFKATLSWLGLLKLTGKVPSTGSDAEMRFYLRGRVAN